MNRNRLDEPSLQNLLRVAKEISDLIEDNNQNIKDCAKALNSINKLISPPKRKFSFGSLISKILNKIK